MIWPAQDPSAEDWQALREHVAELIRAAGTERGPAPEHAAEIAAGIATFCIDAGLQRGMSSGQLERMISCALSNLGESAAALRVLSARSSPVSQADATYDRLSGGRHPHCAWELSARGILRSGHWWSRQGWMLWILDSQRLVREAGCALELTVHRCVVALLRETASLWDACDGHGVLGLVGAHGRGRQSVSGDVRRPITADAEELRRLCEDLLGRLQEERGWRCTPRVVGLDLPIRGKKSCRSR